MYLKRYTIGALIFIIAVGWSVYAFATQDTYALHYKEYALPAMPIAFLIITPLIVFYIASVAHMMYYSLKNFWRLRSYQKDYDRFVDAFYYGYLQLDKKQEFVTERYRFLGKLLQHSTISPNDDLHVHENEKIQELLETLENVKNGKDVELKPYHLDSNNPLTIQNKLNQLNSKPQIADELLTQSNDYPDDLRKKAYESLVKNADLTKILKYRQWLDKETLVTVFERVTAVENPLNLTIDDMMSLVNSVKLDASEYLELAKKFKNCLEPDLCVNLFEKISEENEEATEALLYVLLDLEMNAKAKELLENSQSDEFQGLKAYLSLKEKGEIYNINLFV